MRHAFGDGRDWSFVHDKDAPVGNATLKYTVIGKGEPVLLIHGTNLSDSLVTPLGLYEPLFNDYQIISYYRAGYGGSRLYQPTLSIEEGAKHTVDLLDHLGIEKAHLVAFSFGGVIGFQGLLDYPGRFATATLLEPYLPREEPMAVQANVDAYMKAAAMYQAGDKLGAAYSYMVDICGPSFLSACDMTGPDNVWDRLESGVTASFEVDFPAVSVWGFKPSEAAKYEHCKPTMPILAAMGLDSESVLPGFRETQRFLMSWLPQAERAGIPNATHGMASMNPIAVGEAIHAFLQRHPID